MSNVACKVTAKDPRQQTSLLPQLHHLPKPGIFCSERRQILDNLVAAQDLIYTTCRKNRRNKAFALKADMSMAYDRVEWSFLIQALHMFRLPQQFVNLVKVCVCSHRG